MKIIGRHKEIGLLNQIMASEQAEFLAIYGRRRIGKTYLIETFFQKKKILFFQSTGIQHGTMKEQLNEFSKEIGRVFYGNANLETPSSWLEAFEILTKAITNKKIILFFDEFPWMATPKSRLLQALEFYWNRHWKNNSKIKLIICGSSAAWIIKKIIFNKGGLHNRITHKICLRPFNLNETKQFLLSRGHQVNDQKIAEIYLYIGGIPYYLNHLNPKRSIGENVNEICFQKNGFLFEEFDRLFRSLFKDFIAYEDIVRVIASGQYGIERAKIPFKGGQLTRYLKDLEMAGFIKGFLPLEHSKRGLYYRIFDEYTIFYLKWIEPQKHNLELDIEDNNYWSNLTKKPEYMSWLGYAFESLCYKHVGQIKKAFLISVSCKIGTWRYVPKSGSNDQGAQIDLIFDLSNDLIFLCEIKYTQHPFVITKAYAEILEKKVKVFKEITRTKKQIFICMISANGIKENTYSKKLIRQSIALRDLMSN